MALQEINRPGEAALVFEEFRPGVNTPADGTAWVQWRNKLHGYVDDRAEELLGAVIIRDSLFSRIAVRGAIGSTSVWNLCRPGEHLSPELALAFGNVVCQGWKEICAEQGVPDYCDTIFPIPDQAEHTTAVQDPIDALEVASPDFPAAGLVLLDH